MIFNGSSLKMIAEYLSMHKVLKHSSNYDNLIVTLELKKVFLISYPSTIPLRPF